jgi:hypothetical protein
VNKNYMESKELREKIRRNAEKRRKKEGMED